MGKIPKMPVDVRKLMGFASDLGDSRGLQVNVDLVFDITASDKLIDLILKAFQTEAPQAAVNSVLLESEVPQLPLPCDLCVVVSGESLLVGDVAAAARAKGIPSAVVIAQGETFFTETKEEAQQIIDPAESVHKPVPLDDIVDIDLNAAERPLEELGTWIVRNAPAKRASMADYFSFLRHPLGMEFVKSAAVRAAAVGVLIFIPGADMPAITLEQCQMVLQIASVYGQPLDANRVKEIVAVVAGGFGFRAIARELVELVPGIGFAVKGGVAYGGTLAMGYAVLDYFEGDGVIGNISDALSGATERFTKMAAEQLEALQSQDEE